MDVPLTPHDTAPSDSSEFEVMSLAGLAQHSFGSEAILRYCTIWNTNSRNCHEAQCVLNILLTQVPPDTLLQYSGIRGTVEALLPYTERHLQRMARLLQASMFVDFMWQHMRLNDLPDEKESVPTPVQSLAVTVEEDAKA